jgi:hypothetical protein
LRRAPVVKRYDPEKTPPAAEWLALEEEERQLLIERHHRKARIRLPNARIHAVFHMIVENQLALEDPIVARTLHRLRSEGLTRHDAIHAIASVLADLMYDIFNGVSDNPMDSYYPALEQLTAESWLNS